MSARQLRKGTHSLPTGVCRSERPCRGRGQAGAHRSPLVPQGSYLTASRAQGAPAPGASILLSPGSPRAAAASRSQGLAHWRRLPGLPGTWRTGDVSRGVLPVSSTCGPLRTWPTAPRHRAVGRGARESGGPGSAHGLGTSKRAGAGSTQKPAMS